MSTRFFCQPTLRKIEQLFADRALMQHAGEAAAELAISLCADRAHPILILAGPGNNGGDAFVTAELLRARAYPVYLVCLTDPAALPPEAAAAAIRFVANGGCICKEIPELLTWDLIVDGLFGIGLRRSPEGPYAALIEAANQLAWRDACPLLALDCPSGLDADTGHTPGSAVRATHTITFIAAKPGLYTAEGPDHCGSIVVADLGLTADDLPAADGQLVEPALFAARLYPRRRNSHKGSNGNAGILGGAASMTGAALLASRAALLLGAGRVYVGLLDPHQTAFDAQHPEVMFRHPEGLFAADLTALGCGPGLGRSVQATELVDRAIALDAQLVLDADALNLLAFEPGLQAGIVARPRPALLTPHPAEAARLLDCTTDEVQAARLRAAREIARRYRSWVALKGCGTVIAAPGDELANTCLINTTGNPGMGSAGMGDVLTGILVALLAQGWPAAQALPAAIHLHGMAADDLIDAGIGPVGMTANELISSARTRLNRWLLSKA
jgi:ADP-dependent NAD(P)H-hydrate dehydratase / NAD(P)H-hydrate epimerase